MAYFGTSAGDGIFANLATEIFGLGDGDYIIGRTVAEDIYGGFGNDLIMGSDWGSILGAGTFADPYRYSGFVVNSGDDLLVGDDGNDAIYGGDGNDIIAGGSGSDNGINFLDFNNSYVKSGLYGGDGNDIIYGDAGNDELFGENGDDQLFGGTEDDVLNGGANNDKLYGDDGSDTLYGGTGLDNMQGGNGDDMLIGEDNNDAMNGNAGYDRLIGGLGDDALYGGADNDSLYGDDGVDTLIGGAGVDYMNGGVGADKYRYDGLADTGDVIRFFSSIDTIQLKGSVFGGLAAGALAEARFKSNSTGLATETDDRFIYNTTNDNLYYDSNGSTAGGTKVLIADFSNNFAMEFLDITII